MRTLAAAPERVNPVDDVTEQEPGGALAEALAAIGGGDSPPPAEVLAALKAALAHDRAVARERFEAGAAGLATARGAAGAMDEMVGALLDFTCERVYRASNPTAGERLSAIAVGGYGRGELAPYSDVDLWFVHPYKLTPWGEQVIEYVLYMLWDLGLKVGHATRSVEECIRLAKRDVTIATAMLESRLVWGDGDLYVDLRRRFAAEMMARGGPRFVEAKLAERDTRHHRFGDSRYVVEPNVKEGKGGLRDLHTLYWIGKFLFAIDEVSALVSHGVLSPAELRTFAKAEAFLWTVRFHLHTLSGRPEERLTLDVQPEIGRLLNYADRPGSLGVERFMKHYFLIAKDVGDLTRIFCSTLEESHKRKPRLGLLGRRARRREITGFIAEGGRLNVADENTFRERPIEMLRLFHVADQGGLDIHPHALRLITRNLGAIDRHLRADAEANALFVDILCSDRDPETALRRMNEAGVFGRFVPDFGRVVAQMQYDMYHVYTVDEHAIRAVGNVAAMERGERAADHPLASELVKKVVSRRALYLAMLLHDIGKGRGEDHSDFGARVAHKLGPRMGFTTEETDAVAWLVQHHLLMSETAFRRDVSDVKTVADFVALVRSPERLRMLLVLTEADISAVGPGVWNGWKRQLLGDLYTAAEEVLLGGLGVEGRDERVAAAKRALGEQLGNWPRDELAAHLARCSDSYWLSTRPEDQARHAYLVRHATEAGKSLAIDSRIDHFRAATTLTVYAPDRPGLFARVAGAMASVGASILGAKIFTTVDGMALDTFSVQDEGPDALTGEDKLARLKRAIEDAVAGEVMPEPPSAPHSARARRLAAFVVEPQVSIDNRASEGFTVIEVEGRDRPALLYDLTRALGRFHLSISSAHIATFGERAVDVFYVTNRKGAKITRSDSLKRIRARLIEALRAPGRTDPEFAPGRAAAVVREDAGARPA